MPDDSRLLIDPDSGDVRETITGDSRHLLQRRLDQAGLCPTHFDYAPS